MNKPLIVIFIAIGLDAVGIGLIFPILPRLLKDVTHVDNVVPYIGIMTALYAVMQFIFAPILGALSDRVADLARRGCHQLRGNGVRAATLDAARCPRHSRTD
jgi:MFS family permease